MDEAVFEQLDALQSNARDLHEVGRLPRHDDVNPAYYDHASGYPDDDYEAWSGQTENDFSDHPMSLDSFDERLLQQPDPDTRHGQAALGTARLSLPPFSSHPETPRNPASGYRTFNTTLAPPQPPLSSLSRFAYTPDLSRLGPSSPVNHRVFSSPSPGPVGYTNTSEGQRSRPSKYSTGYQNDCPARSSTDHQDVRGLNAPFVTQQSDNNRRRNDATHQVSNLGAPVVQGISLVSTRGMPDRFRSIFPFPLFNAVQSKCFDGIYMKNDNLVLSAPTGSGKTAVLELAICRLVNSFSSDSFKIVYQAPTKSLCSERQRDWQAKFSVLGLHCAELTGDTENAQLQSVQRANIIVTTPEKWDSITRKWKDHQKLMHMIKLFLIDEVHILREDRGATLEAVVSRMKSVGTNVRFIALSATIPNAQDIAVWLGKDPLAPQLPATMEKFGEEFRPVRLQKHVCGYQSKSNEFGFEQLLNGKLPDIIARYSQRKPIMIFCFTRKSCIETAKLLANWWATKPPANRAWASPPAHVAVYDQVLRDTISSGVAFHHAGLGPEDRMAVEKGYLDGKIKVICCTSTLAVGVNLPCHLVIVKNTVSYQGTGGCKEYSDLEVMQMLGRAGRPQFDDSAVAVIMTRLQRVHHYEKMVSGQEVLESCLHLNLIEHLNAEIGLGTITSAATARKWLNGTFLCVRLKINPQHYKLKGGIPGQTVEETLESICEHAIESLQEYDLVRGDQLLQCTEFGESMARYYIQFETMKVFKALPPKAKVSEILSAISQASEFRDIRWRAGEKAVYKELNKNISIKFPLPGHIDLSVHKVSLIIQSVLGAADNFPDEARNQEYVTCKSQIFQNCQRLIRCVIDCQLSLGDSTSARNALMLARSLSAQIWDDSPLHIKQLDGIGVVGVRRLVAAGMKSIEELEQAEPHQIERALSRNPPYGTELQARAKSFPRPRISLKTIGEPVVKEGEPVSIKIQANIGFINDVIPVSFRKRPIYVCLLVDNSDGHLVHFARISARQLNQGKDVLFTANLSSPSQSVRASLMCVDIAGTQRTVTLKPEVPISHFPQPRNMQEISKHDSATERTWETSRGLSGAKSRRGGADEYGDPAVDDSTLALAETAGFIDLEQLEKHVTEAGLSKVQEDKASQSQSPASWQPRQLANGHWACNHPCNDKTKCKHLCCREGLEKKPKPPKAKGPTIAHSKPDPKQTTLMTPVSKKLSNSQIATPAKSTNIMIKVKSAKELPDPNRLHTKKDTTSSGSDLPIFGSRRSMKANTATFVESPITVPAPSTLQDDNASSDYGQDAFSSEELLMDPMDTSWSSGMGNTTTIGDRHFESDTMLDELDLTCDAPRPPGHGGRDRNTHDSASRDLCGSRLDDVDAFGNVRRAAWNGVADPNMNPEKEDSTLFVSGDSSDTLTHVPPRFEPYNMSFKRPSSATVDTDDRSSFFPSSKRSKTMLGDASPDREASAMTSAEDYVGPGAFLQSVGTHDLEPGLQTARDEPSDLEEWFKHEFGTENFNFIR